MSKRSRLPKTYDYTFGAFEVPEAKATSDFVSSLVPRAIVIGGLGALAYWLFFSAKAAAKENAKNTTLATGKETGGNVTAEQGARTFVDPGSRVSVVGPSETVVLSNDKHTVKANESWANIASRVYGDYRWWPALWDANRASGRFGSPTTLAVGDVIVVPKLPVESARFKKLVFDRAELDRKWEVKKLKKGAKAAGPRPKSTFAATPILATDLPVTVVPVPASVTQPALPEPKQEAVRAMDYTTTGPANDGTEVSAGYEDLSS